MARDTSFSYSFLVLPADQRRDIGAIWDFCRAVDDGVDAIMLAGETAAGAHPVRAVQTLDAIIRDAETCRPADVRALRHDGEHEIGRAHV